MRTRLFVATPFTALPLLAQNESVGWEPIHRTPNYLSWQFLVPCLIFALACYGLWRFIGWAVEKYRDSIPWGFLRRWWPAIMLSWGWVLVAGMYLCYTEDLAFNILVGVFFVFHLPTVLAGGFVKDSV